LNRRYQHALPGKAEGVAYTPPGLADFVAAQVAGAAPLPKGPLRVLDPAVGDGALLISLLTRLAGQASAPIAVYGFDTDPAALERARRRLGAAFPGADLHLTLGDFLDFCQTPTPGFDLIIANPPYVRTQIMGADAAQKLGAAFGLWGRIDRYHAFLIGIAQVLRPGGAAGIIVSNRFMTTKGGGRLRAALRTRLALEHVWDLGDTRLFDAAVLPAVILAAGKGARAPRFTTIYETSAPATVQAPDPVAALAMAGPVVVADGRRFHVQHGRLDTSGPDDDLWRIATAATDTWLGAVAAQTWATFGQIGTIRVGVKTCADRVFIRGDWAAMPDSERPELLRPLATHHSAGRFRAGRPVRDRMILYPHESVGGRRRVVELADYPNSRAYLETHRATLEGRTYVAAGGRRWYEIWVPQDPAAWSAPKLVFRDIAERPSFWIDLDGGVVNGDCYWLTADRPDDAALLWLAAGVANSTFIEAFYDVRFNNKLYAGRRRFMTQYVALFPLPDPATALAQDIAAAAKAIYACAGTAEAAALEARLDGIVWRAFGLERPARLHENGRAETP
jgi:adenine-specific DNA-methyltransferase